jgi:ketosteroid isomerase-like protein
VRILPISLAVSVAASSLFLTVPGLAPAAPPAGASIASDSADAVATVGRFRAALASGDSATALALLAPDAIVLESGAAESRAEYRRHHLPADIEYARAAPGTHALVQAIVHDDAAWVSSTSVTTGTVKGRAVDSAGAELIVLSRRDRQSPWQIRAIHWSSRRRAS